MADPYCAAYVRLELDGADDLTIDMDGTDGLFLVDLDLGYPTVRETVEMLNGADGTNDTTEHFGARVVSVRMIAVDTDTLTRQEVLDRLSRFLVPRARPVLYYALTDGSAERRVVLRPQNRSAPLLAPWWGPSQDVQAAWVGPNGLIEAAGFEEREVSAAGDEAEGVTFPITFPVVFPTSSVVGAVTVHVDGQVNVSPVLRLYGPATNPRIENQTTDRRYVFGNATAGDLVLAAGEYVEIDVAARTVTLNGDASQSRYQFLDLSVSQWWTLEPGDNELRYYPEIFDVGSAATIIWRPAWV